MVWFWSDSLVTHTIITVKDFWSTHPTVISTSDVVEAILVNLIVPSVTAGFPLGNVNVAGPVVANPV